MKTILLKFILIFVALCFLNSCHKSIVIPPNTVSVASSTPTLCVNTALTAISHSTTGATGIGVSTGLPAGVTAAWFSNVITLSGTPKESGTFTYTIPLTGGSGTVIATGTITIAPVNTVSTASSIPAILINTALTAITHTTTGATGIGVATGLPAGVTATWAANLITINGTPTESGTFNYTIPLTGGCGTVAATGTINVTCDYLPLKVGSKYLYSNYGSFSFPGEYFTEVGKCEWEFFDKTPNPPYIYRVRQILNGIHLENKNKLDITSTEMDTTLITNRIDTLTFQENGNGTVTIKCPIAYWKYASETVPRYVEGSKNDTCFILNYINHICLTKNVGIKSLSFYVNGNHHSSTSYGLEKGPY